MIHHWSKDATAAFWKAAALGARRLDVRRGLDAAIQVEAPVLAPLFAAIWAEALTEEGSPPRFFRVTQGDATVVLEMNREFLFKALGLTLPSMENVHDAPEVEVPEGAAAPDAGAATDGPGVRPVRQPADGV